MKRIKKIIVNKWFYLFFAPLIIFLSCAAFSLYYIVTYDAHFTVMPVVHSNNMRLIIPQNTLVDGKVIKGEFTASDPNLGSIALRIKNEHIETVPDNFQVIFRVKEKGAKEWYSSNTYHGGQFHELDLFPFGFNLIADSKGKTYSFELLSNGANEYNALTVNQKQKIVGLYQLNKSDLKNPVNAVNYGVRKLVYLFTNVGAVFTALIYFLPLYAYFFLIVERDSITVPAFLRSIFLINHIRQKIVTPIAKWINKLMKLLNKHKLIDEYKPVKNISLLNIVLVITIFVEIFLIEGTNNMLLLLILLLWGITIPVNKIRLQTAFLFALGFLVLCFVLFIAGLDTFAEKAAIWVYLFLVIGTFHSLFTWDRKKKT